MRLEAGGKTFLFTGDCTGPNEAAVGSICARGPPIDVLKVAHHGSRYSTSAAFLADTRPRVAVICVGPNGYGHPTPATVGRLLGGGSRVYTTWRNGAVTITVSAAGALRATFSRSSRPVNDGDGYGRGLVSAGDPAVGGSQSPFGTKRATSGSVRCSQAPCTPSCAAPSSTCSMAMPKSMGAVQ